MSKSEWLYHDGYEWGLINADRKRTGGYFTYTFNLSPYFNEAEWERGYNDGWADLEKVFYNDDAITV